ncbi:uncharacterized protein LOC120351898 [Nilaparvata lugens]|uniref:uncharacterized protein LOC120351898 n=1 Tax=Nilaparvata lugens TaxID=108931 RepID=UPI00193DE9B6|nr:uncharacterized protein LOC120351898 [Nilaparvata lugens]
MNSSSSSAHQDYILPDTPSPQQSTSFPSYWAARAAQQKKKLPTTTTTAAATPDSDKSPLKSRGIFVERDLSSEEIIVPDSPPSSTSHPEWAPRRVPLTMISNKQQQQQQQGKRKLHFLDEEDEETIFVPSNHPA